MEKNRYLGAGMFELEMNNSDIAIANLTPAKLRDIILDGQISSGPGLDIMYMPTSAELNNLYDMARDAVTKGRLFDFGHLPNEQIKQTGARAGKLYNESAIGHPFSEPYLILHTWSDPKLDERLGDGLGGIASCAYLINPMPIQGETCISFEACSMECMLIKGRNTLCIGDRLLFDGAQSKGSGMFFADIIPYAYRWKTNNTMMENFAIQFEGSDFVRLAASNILDPLMMCLLILNTRGIQTDIVKPSDKLANARRKAGKSAIPSYRKVDTANYVTALLARQERPKGPSQGGTHASPAFHLRRGHWRRLDEAGTKKTFIQDTLVNATDEMRATFRMTRSHYSVKE